MRLPFLPVGPPPVARNIPFQLRLSPSKRAKPDRHRFQLPRDQAVPLPEASSILDSVTAFSVVSCLAPQPRAHSLFHISRPGDLSSVSTVPNRAFPTPIVSPTRQEEGVTHPSPSSCPRHCRDWVVDAAVPTAATAIKPRSWSSPGHFDAVWFSSPQRRHAVPRRSPFRGGFGTLHPIE
jgi:hypothetical protein